MSRVTTSDIVKICGVKTQTVYGWITRGLIKGVQVGTGTHKRWEFEEEEFNRFLREGNYEGYCDKIKSSIPFTRVLDVEECYPINLLYAVLERSTDAETIDESFDIWNYDIKKFKTFIDDLTDREKKVIELRFHFGMTLYEAGNSLGLTKERIRQLEVRARRKLRHMIAGRGCEVVSKNDYDALLQLKESEMEIIANAKCAEPVKNDFDILLEKDIDMLDLSVRSYNCLKRAGIVSVKDIIDFDKKQDPLHTWLHIRNLGRKSEVEIAEKVKKYCDYDLRIPYVKGNEIIFLDLKAYLKGDTVYA